MKGYGSRYNYNWRPHEDDDNTYVWRNGYWYAEDELDDDNLDLEEFEEKRRQRIAIQNEY